MNESLVLNTTDEMTAVLVGNKAFHLKQCLEWGCQVPKFVVVPATLSQALYRDSAIRDRVATQALAILPQGRYAVRSSSLVEDDVNQSKAGQFMTCLNLLPQEIGEALFQVLDQARTVAGDVGTCAVIIQEFVAPDIAGVLFTRNPLGGREMVVEYSTGTGDKLVGGGIEPKRDSVFWNEKATDHSSFFHMYPMVSEVGKLLEQRFGSPQDIEWCICGKEFFVVQSRPITTLTRQQYEEILLLESVLPVNQPYFYEKTELSEIAPRPVPVTFDVLQHIYASDGPVAQVYQKYHIRYRDTEFLTLLGNELYVDKERELRSLFPAWTQFRSQTIKPRWRSLRGFWATLSNLVRLSFVRIRGQEQLLKVLRHKVEAVHSPSEPKRAWHLFLEEYQTIFEINLLTGFALSRAERALRRESMSLSQILRSGLPIFPQIVIPELVHHETLRGNSLDIADESQFSYSVHVASTDDTETTTWWQSLSKYKQTFLQPYLIEAYRFARMREIGRWLTVKNVHALREALLRQATKSSFLDPSHIYFASWAEILGGEIGESTCIERKKKYEEARAFTLPARINSVHGDELAVHGVSPGVVSGILVTRSDVEVNRYDGEQRILYTEILSPDLVQYFDRILGIVSENGGLLSHLAIVARERGVPVVVGCSLQNQNFVLGSRVHINGSTGEIGKVASNESES